MGTGARPLALLLQLALALLLLAPRPAAAAPSGDELFRAHHARALELYQARRYEEAIAALEAAYALRPDPRLQLNLGHACRRLGRGEQALEHYRRYREQMPDLSAADLAAVEEYMALARRAAEPGQEPAAGPGRDPAREPGRDPAREPGKEPGREPASAPAREPAKDPGPAPAAAPAKDPGQRTAAALPARPPSLALPAGSLVARPLPPATPPLYRRWWFWGIVGVAAAGAVAAAVLSTQPWDANLPPGAPIHDPKF